MSKSELLQNLKNFKKSIQDFHNKSGDYTINIPIGVVEDEIKNNSNYQNHNLEENTKLKNAIYHVESDRISKKRKKEIYEIDKSNLKQQYGRLTQYISLFSGHPAIDKFPCYDGYFLNDGYQGEEKNFPSVISDIDIMIGKIEALEEKELQKILKGSTRNWWKELNPVWWIYQTYKFLRKFKFLSIAGGILLFILGIIVTKSTEPIVDFITKPLQNYSSGLVQGLSSESNNENPSPSW